MNKQKQANDLGRKVMGKIQQGEISMRPKIYFSVLTGISVLAILTMSVMLSYLTSIVILWLRVESALGPAFGARRNLETLVGSFPWWAVLASILLLCGIVFFLKRYSNLYRFRWQTLVVSSILVAAIVGLVLSNTDLPNIWKHNKSQNQCSLSDDCQPSSNR